MSKTKIIISSIFLIITIVGVVVGVLLMRRQQDIRRKAAVPGGIATIEISPVSGSFNVDQEFTVNLRFNTNGETVSGISVRLVHNSPEVQLVNSQINPSLLSTGTWSCPVQPSQQQQGNSVFVDLACVNTSIGGFVSSGTTDLVTLTFKANSMPSVNPVVLTFDNALTVITKKSTSEDTLLIPQTSGSYTITQNQEGQEDQEPTASPTVAPTAKPTSTASPTAVPTTSPGVGGTNPTVAPTLAPSSTGVQREDSGGGSTGQVKETGKAPTLPPDVPDTGVGIPVFMGIGVGGMLLVLGLLLSL